MTIEKKKLSSARMELKTISCQIYFYSYQALDVKLKYKTQSE